VDRTGKLLPKLDKPSVVYRTLTQQQSSSSVLTETNVGNTNGSGVQNNNSAPSVNYNGPVATEGSHLSVIYNNPPITDVQKQQAREALMEDLNQLATYPESVATVDGPTVVQRMFRYGAPRALYSLLVKYYDKTILSIPYGVQLIGYKKSYYDFEQSAKNFESVAVPKMGDLSKGQFPASWSEYLRYCVLRRNGYSKDAVIAKWGTMGFVDFNKADDVCAAFQADPQFGLPFNAYSASIDAFTGTAQQLLAAYK